MSSTRSGSTEIRTFRFGFATFRSPPYTLPMETQGSIAVVDFGGQYAHLIANRVRRFGFRSHIVTTDCTPRDLEGVAGIILSGGPQSVYEAGSPQADPEILSLGVPVLGLCYGHQWLAQALGGSVASAAVKEYGPTSVTVTDSSSPLLVGIPEHFTVWMSHGDEVKTLPEGFVTTITTEACAHAGMMDMKRKFFGIQFHIEVIHTEYGMDILKSFVDLCSPAPWSVESYAKLISDEVRREAGDRNVFMLVSGGVDSTVAFTLLNQVLGHERVKGLLVDTGLMRKDEVRMINDAFDALDIDNLHTVDASEEFFANLKDVYDPEEKRKIIGETFLAVQKRVFEDMGLNDQGGMWLLGQGTIYPDTIETGGTKHADKIKTHHNRVEMIQKMIEQGLVIEPLKDLYKDEVRRLGEELGLPHDLVWRHPFPGPGLGVRILCGTEELRIKNEELSIEVGHCVLPIKSVGVQGDGRSYRHPIALFNESKFPDDRCWKLATDIPNRIRDFNRVVFCSSHGKPPAFVFTPGYVTRERADILRAADAIVLEEMRAAKLYEVIWQFPVVLIPVGIAGGESIVLRPVESQEAMTANAAVLPKNVLARITERILAIDGIDAVFYDLTHKPPATIEWE